MIFKNKENLFNRQLKILLITNSLVLVAGAMLGPIYALFVEDIGGDLLSASYSFGAFALAAGFVTLISGKYTDQVKEKKSIITIGYLLMSLGFFLYLAVNSIWMLLVVQVIIGFGEAIYAPALDSIYSAHISRRKSGRQWATWEALYYFTTFVGAIAGGLLISQFGFNPAFILMGFLALGSALYILFLPKKVL